MSLKFQLMQNSILVSIIIKGTLMQIWKFDYMFGFI